jgi:FkbM family methyltransferase
MFAEAFRRLLSWHGGSRAILSGPLYKFSRRYVMAWSNVEADMNINGERWIIESIARHTPAKGAVYIDVGANRGDWSKHVLANAPEARLLAFEPVPAMRDELQQNLAGSHAEIFDLALSDAAGRLQINYIASNPHISSLETLGEGWADIGEPIEVELSTGDAVCAAHGVDHIRFLKIDTEGHDLKALRGFRGMLDRSAIDVIQFEHNFMSIYSRTFLKDFFAELTPTMRIGRLLRKRVEFFDYAPALDNFIQANFIAVRADLAAGELKFLARQ